jgi:hypothetical protein
MIQQQALQRDPQLMMPVTTPLHLADGGDENIRQWWCEEGDLREVYPHIWPDGAPAHLIDIAIFCDSDETHGHTVSYFADVKLRR